jgi:toxin FitB
MIFDSNLLILSAKPEMLELRQWFALNQPSYSTVSKIEVLGFRKLVDEDKVRFEKAFSQFTTHPVNDAVIDQAVLLCQQHKLGLGHAIIAATALVTDQELATNDLTDFVGIPGLRVVYPLLSLTPQTPSP